MADGEMSAAIVDPLTTIAQSSSVISLLQDATAGLEASLRGQSKNAQGVPEALRAFENAVSIARHGVGNDNSESVESTISSESNELVDVHGASGEDGEDTVASCVSRLLSPAATDKYASRSSASFPQRATSSPADSTPRQVVRNQFSMCDGPLRVTQASAALLADVDSNANLFDPETRAKFDVAQLCVKLLGAWRVPTQTVVPTRSQISLQWGPKVAGDPLLLPTLLKGIVMTLVSIMQRVASEGMSDKNASAPPVTTLEIAAMIGGASSLMKQIWTLPVPQSDRRRFKIHAAEAIFTSTQPPPSKSGDSNVSTDDVVLGIMGHAPPQPQSTSTSSTSAAAATTPCLHETVLEIGIDALMDTLTRDGLPDDSPPPFWEEHGERVLATLFSQLCTALQQLVRDDSIATTATSTPNTLSTPAGDVVPPPPPPPPPSVHQRRRKTHAGHAGDDETHRRDPSTMLGRLFDNVSPGGVGGVGSGDNGNGERRQQSSWSSTARRIVVFLRRTVFIETHRTRVSLNEAAVDSLLTILSLCSTSRYDDQLVADVRGIGCSLFELGFLPLSLHRYVISSLCDEQGRWPLTLPRETIAFITRLLLSDADRSFSGGQPAGLLASRVWQGALMSLQSELDTSSANVDGRVDYMTSEHLLMLLFTLHTIDRAQQLDIVNQTLKLLSQVAQACGRDQNKIGPQVAEVLFIVEYQLCHVPCRPPKALVQKLEEVLLVVRSDQREIRFDPELDRPPPWTLSAVLNFAKKRYDSSARSRGSNKAPKSLETSSSSGGLVPTSTSTTTTTTSTPSQASSPPVSGSTPIPLIPPPPATTAPPKPFLVDVVDPYAKLDATFLEKLDREAIKGLRIALNELLASPLLAVNRPSSLEREHVLLECASVHLCWRLSSKLDSAVSLNSSDDLPPAHAPSLAVGHDGETGTVLLAKLAAIRGRLRGVSTSDAAATQSDTSPPPVDQAAASAVLRSLLEDLNAAAEGKVTSSGTVAIEQSLQVLLVVAAESAAAQTTSTADPVEAAAGGTAAVTLTPPTSECSMAWTRALGEMVAHDKKFFAVLFKVMSWLHAEWVRIAEAQLVSSVGREKATERLRMLRGCAGVLNAEMLLDRRDVEVLVSPVRRLGSPLDVRGELERSLWDMRLDGWECSVIESWLLARLEVPYGTSSESLRRAIDALAQLCVCLPLPRGGDTAADVVRGDAVRTRVTDLIRLLCDVTNDPTFLFVRDISAEATKALLYGSHDIASQLDTHGRLGRARNFVVDVMENHDCKTTEYPEQLSDMLQQCVAVALEASRDSKRGAILMHCLLGKPLPPTLRGLVAAPTVAATNDRSGLALLLKGLHTADAATTFRLLQLLIALADLSAGQFPQGAAGMHRAAASSSLRSSMVDLLVSEGSARLGRLLQRVLIRHEAPELCAGSATTSGSQSESDGNRRAVGGVETGIVLAMLRLLAALMDSGTDGSDALAEMLFPELLAVLSKLVSARRMYMKHSLAILGIVACRHSHPERMLDTVLGFIEAAPITGDFTPASSSGLSLGIELLGHLMRAATGAAGSLVGSVRSKLSSVGLNDEDRSERDRAGSLSLQATHYEDMSDAHSQASFAQSLVSHTISDVQDDTASEYSIESSNVTCVSSTGHMMDDDRTASPYGSHMDALSHASVDMDVEVVSFGGDDEYREYGATMPQYLEDDQNAHQEFIRGMAVGDGFADSETRDGFADSETIAEEEPLDLLCTYTGTGKTFSEQHWYHCWTCGLTFQKGCCNVCVRVCHKGHDVSYSRFSRFFCDCGSGDTGPNGVACTALQARDSASQQKGLPSSSLRTANVSAKPGRPASNATSSVRRTYSFGLGDLTRALRLTDTQRDCILGKLRSPKVVAMLVTSHSRLAAAVLNAPSPLSSHWMPLLPPTLSSLNPIVVDGNDAFELKRALAPASFATTVPAEVPRQLTQRRSGNSAGSSASGPQSTSSAVPKEFAPQRRKSVIALCHEMQALVIGEGNKLTIIDARRRLLDNAATETPNVDKNSVWVISKVPLAFESFHVVVNPDDERLVAVAGLRDVQVFSLDSKCEVVASFTLQLGLDAWSSTLQICDILWVPTPSSSASSSSSVQMSSKLAVVTSAFVNIYDLSTDIISPEVSLTIKEDIAAATFATNDKDGCVAVVMGASGDTYAHDISASGPVTVQTPLKIPGAGAGGQGLWFSRLSRALIASYADGACILSLLGADLTSVRDSIVLPTSTLQRGGGGGESPSAASSPSRTVYHTARSPTSSASDTPGDNPTVSGSGTISFGQHWVEVAGCPGLFVCSGAGPAGCHLNSVIVGQERIELLPIQAVTNGRTSNRHHAVVGLVSCTGATPGVLAMWYNGRLARLDIGTKLREHKALIACSHVFERPAASAPKSVDFPLDFFEATVNMTHDVAFGGDVVQKQLGDEAQRKMAGGTSGAFVSPHTDHLKLVVTNNNRDMIIVGILVLVGQASTAHVPCELRVFDRTIEFKPGEKRWYSVPLTDEEAINADPSLVINTSGTSNASNPPVIDQIEVYGVSKQTFGFGERKKQLQSKQRDNEAKTRTRTERIPPLHGALISLTKSMAGRFALVGGVSSAAGDTSCGASAVGQEQTRLLDLINRFTLHERGTTLVKELRSLLKSQFETDREYAVAKDNGTLRFIASELSALGPTPSARPPLLIVKLLAMFRKVVAKERTDLTTHVLDTNLLNELPVLFWEAWSCWRWHFPHELTVDGCECLAEALTMCTSMIVHRCAGSANASASDLVAVGRSSDAIAPSVRLLLQGMTFPNHPARLAFSYRLQSLIGVNRDALMIGDDIAAMGGATRLADSGAAGAGGGAADAHSPMHTMTEVPILVEPDAEGGAVMYCCDRCQLQPIRGVRWHCDMCPDYDLCGNCRLVESHERTDTDAVDSEMDNLLYPEGVDPTDENALIALAIKMSTEDGLDTDDTGFDNNAMFHAALCQSLCEQVGSVKDVGGVRLLPVLQILHRLVTTHGNDGDGLARVIVNTLVPSLIQGGGSNRSCVALEFDLLVLLLFNLLLKHKDPRESSGSKHPAQAQSQQSYFSSNASSERPQSEILSGLRSPELLQYLRETLVAAMDRLRAATSTTASDGAAATQNNGGSPMKDHGGGGGTVAVQSSSTGPVALSRLFRPPLHLRARDVAPFFHNGSNPFEDGAGAGAIDSCIVAAVVQLVDYLQWPERSSSRRAATSTSNAPATVSGAGASPPQPSVASLVDESWVGPLCTVISSQESSNSQAKAKKVLLSVCKTRSKYYKIRDTSSFDTHCEDLRSSVLCKPQRGYELSHAESVAVTKAFNGITKAATTRPKNWQKYCRRHKTVLPMLTSILHHWASEFGYQVLRLLVFAFGARGSKDHGKDGKDGKDGKEDKSAPRSPPTSDATEVTSKSTKGKEKKKVKRLGDIDLGNLMTVRHFSQFLMRFLLENNVSATRIEARNFVICLWFNSSDSRRSLIFESVLKYVADLPCFGRNAQEYQELLTFIIAGTFTLGTAAASGGKPAPAPVSNGKMASGTSGSKRESKDASVTATASAASSAMVAGLVEQEDENTGDSSSNSTADDKSPSTGLSTAVLEHLPSLVERMVANVRSQADLLDRHPNAFVYQSLGEILDIQGYFLESEPCLVCSDPEHPFATIKLDKSFKANTKYTDSSQIVKLPVTSSIQRVTITLSEVKRSRMVRTVTLFYNTKAVSSLSELQNKWGLWKELASVQLAPEQTQVKVDLAIPVTSVNFMVHYADFHANPNPGHREQLTCPRCNRLVTDRHGNCKHCHENANQCRMCRNINYENLQAFLCNECGFSKFARIEVSISARPSTAVEIITCEDEKAKAMLSIQKESENSHARFEQILSLKQKILQLLGSLSRDDGDSSGEGGVQIQASMPVLGGSIGSNVGQAMQTTTSSLCVKRRILMLGLAYGKDCRQVFESMARSVRLLMGTRKELVRFLREQQGDCDDASHATEGPGAGASGDDMARDANHCYGCAHSFYLQSLVFFEAVTRRPEAAKQMIDLGLLTELLNVGMHLGSAQHRRRARQTICLLTVDNPAATKQAFDSVSQQVDTFVQSSRGGTANVCNAVALLTDLCAVDDSLWEWRLNSMMKLFFQAAGVEDDSPAVSEHILLPCLEILVRNASVDAAETAPATSATLTSAVPVSGAVAGSAGPSSTTMSVPALTSPPPGASQEVVELVAAAAPPLRAAPAADFARWPTSQSFDSWRSHQASVQSAAAATHDGDGADEWTPKQKLLARRYAFKWAGKCPTVGRRITPLPTLLTAPWIRRMLLNRVSNHCRKQARLLLMALASASPERSLAIVDMLRQLLEPAVKAGEAGVSFFQLIDDLSKDEPTKLYLTARGFLPSLVGVMRDEVNRLVRQESVWTSDITQGFALRMTVNTLERFLQGPRVMRSFKRDEGLVAIVLHIVINVNSLVVQRTKLTDDCSASLKKLFSSMVSESDDEKKRFMRACLSALSENLSGRSPIFLLEQLVSIICPVQPEPVRRMVLNKAPTQEEFIRGSMKQNPYASSEVGPLMRDVKNKICIDLELQGFLDDDNGMELMVAGNLIKLDLAVTKVYDQVWKPTLPLDLQQLPEAKLPPMTIVYRLCGLDGEATEPQIDTLPDVLTEERDPEAEFALSSVMADASHTGLRLLLKLFEQTKGVTPSRDMLAHVGRLLVSSSKIRVNRLALLELGAVGQLLQALERLVQYSDLKTVSEQVLTTIKLLVDEYNLTTSAGGGDGGGDGANVPTQSDGGEGMRRLLAIMSSKGIAELGDRRQVVTNQAAGILPFLTYGGEKEMAELVAFFAPHLDFAQKDRDVDDKDGDKGDKADVPTAADDTTVTAGAGGGSETEMEHSWIVDLFSTVATHLGNDQISHQLRNALTHAGVLSQLLSYLGCLFPAQHSAAPSKAPTWAEAIEKPGLPASLAVLAGMANRHAPTQNTVLAMEGVASALHAMEGVTSTNRVGTLAEACLAALTIDNAEAEAQVAALRDATQKTKRDAAMVERERVLAEMGLGPAGGIGTGGMSLAALGLEGETDLDLLDDEEELSCVVCKEGYMFKPEDVLGVYVNFNRIQLPTPATTSPSPAAARRGSTGLGGGRGVGVSLTSIFVLIHSGCHDEAARAERTMKTPRQEWEGASMRNQQTPCNDLLPLRGPTIAEAAYSNAVDRFWANVVQNGRVDDGRFRVIAHAISLLVRRSATGTERPAGAALAFANPLPPLPDSSGAGGNGEEPADTDAKRTTSVNSVSSRGPNVKMLPALMQLAYHTVRGQDGAELRQAERFLTDTRNAVEGTGSAVGPGSSLGQAASVSPARGASPGSGSFGKSSAMPGLSGAAVWEGGIYYAVVALLLHSGEDKEWVAAKVVALKIMLASAGALARSSGCQKTQAAWLFAALKPGLVSLQFLDIIRENVVCVPPDAKSGDVGLFIEAVDARLRQSDIECVDACVQAIDDAEADAGVCESWMEVLDVLSILGHVFEVGAEPDTFVQSIADTVDAGGLAATSAAQC